MTQPSVERLSESIARVRGAALPRRTLLAAAALLGAGARLPRVRDERDTLLDFEAFLSEAVPLARDLLGDTSRAGQDRYLFSLGALAACLRDVPIPEMRAMSAPALRDGMSEAPSAAPKAYLGANDCEAPFTVLHWRLEPGARIGLHPHIYGNVVTVLLEGEVRIENFEMVGARDFATQDPFPVRRTNDSVLLPGGVNLVSLEHGYVHGFEAGPNGARGLDLTTRIRERVDSPSLIVTPEPLDAARRIFEGRWKYA